MRRSQAVAARMENAGPAVDIAARWAMFQRSSLRAGKRERNVNAPRCCDGL